MKRKVDQAARVARSATRVMAYMDKKWGGNVKLAAAALGVEHTMLWRAATGAAQRGPSVPVLEALQAHSKKPMSYWSGRDT